MLKLMGLWRCSRREAPTAIKWGIEYTLDEVQPWNQNGCGLVNFLK
jgi:hypothetical protein